MATSTLFNVNIVCNCGSNAFDQFKRYLPLTFCADLAMSMTFRTIFPYITLSSAIANFTLGVFEHMAKTNEFYIAVDNIGKQTKSKSFWDQAKGAFQAVSGCAKITIFRDSILKKLKIYSWDSFCLFGRVDMIAYVNSVLKNH